MPETLGKDDKPGKPCRKLPMKPAGWTVLVILISAALAPTAPAFAGAKAPTAGRGGFGTANWLVLAAYLTVMVAIGAYFSRRERSTDDFFLAGRRIPWWAAGLSIVGTGLSAITFMALPAKAYATDWTYFLGNIAPILVIPLVTAFYLPFYRRLNIRTAYEYLEKRFNLAARLIGSGFYVCFQFLRMAVVLYLPALALSTVTGLNVYHCILVMGLLCIVYTVMGGIEAVIWTDVLQVVVLFGSAVLCLCVIVAEVDGGLPAIISAGRQAGKLRLAKLDWDPTAAVLWVVVAGNFFNAFMPNTADQGVVQRYLTVRDLNAARRAAWVSGLSVIPTSLLFFTLGTALWAFYQAHPQLLRPGLRNDEILPLFVIQQMPPGVAGLVIAGVFAAAMSSLDSSMNAVAAVVTTDVYRRFKPTADERRCLRLARWVTAITGAVGMAAALLMAGYHQQIKSLWDVFLAVLGLMGGALAGMFILGIFTRRAHAVGVCIGAAAGSTAAILAWQFSPLNSLLYGAVGLVTCVAVGYVASLLLPGRQNHLTGLTIHTPGQNHQIFQ